MGDILFLAHRVPYPPNRGDKIRGFHILKHLSKRARVHLIAFADDAADLVEHDELAAMTASRLILWRGKSQAVAAVQSLIGGRPVSLTAFDDGAMRARVAALLAREDIDTIYVYSSQMAQYLPAVPLARVIMDFVDMDSAKFADYGAATGPMAWMMRREARKLFAHECDVAARAHASLFVSAAEAALFRDRSGATGVAVVENGIDTRFFDPAADFATVEEAGPLIVFTGQMDYRPNIEAVAWFAEAILPIVRRTYPKARFAIVGRAPTEAVTALAALPGVIVTGEVADIRGWLAAASIVVAPLKLARGIQNKVLEAMAMARPAVVSLSAAEGIDHDGTILIGHSAADIAASIGALLDNPAAALALGDAARAQVRRRYSWEARLAPIDALLMPDERTRSAA